MDQIKRRDAGLAYIADKEVMEQQKRARKLTQELNTVDRSDFEKIEKIVKELLENPKVLLSILRSIAIMDLISKSERIFMQIIIVRF